MIATAPMTTMMTPATTIVAITPTTSIEVDTAGFFETAAAMATIAITMGATAAGIQEVDTAAVIIDPIIVDEIITEAIIGLTIVGEIIIEPIIITVTMTGPMTIMEEVVAAVIITEGGETTNFFQGGEFNFLPPFFYYPG